MKKRGKCLLSVVLILTMVRPVVAAPVEMGSVPVEMVLSTEAAETASESTFLEEDTVAETTTTESIETDTEGETKETETETAETRETETETAETRETEIETSETKETETEPDQNTLISQITSATVDLKSVKCQAFNAIKITWKSAEGVHADGYAVFRKQGNGSWQRIAVTDGNAYKDTSVQFGQTYTYTVRAYKKISNKEYLSQYNRKGLECKAVPEAPVLKIKTQEGSKLALSWSMIEGTDTYKVYERDQQSGKWKELAKTKDTSLTITAEGGQTHTYTVRAIKRINGKDVLSDYNTKGVSVKVNLSAPVLVGAKSTGTNSIQVTWKKSSSKSYYRIYRKGQKDKQYKAIADTANLNYTDKTTVPGEMYTYTVKAYVKNGDQRIYSDYDKKGVSASSKPATPSLKSAKSASYNSVTVSWQAVEGATNYKVYRKNGNAGYKLIKTLGSTSFTDTGLVCGTSYTYTVKAYVKVNNKAIESDYNKKGLSATPMLTTPVLKSAQRSEDGYAVLKWDKVQGADGYRIYKKLPGGTWEYIQNANKSETTFRDYDAVANTVYAYTVRAYRQSSGKTWMSGYNKTGKYLIDQVELALALNESGTSKINVGWYHIKGADGYYVYRKENGGSWEKIGDLSAADAGDIDAGELISGMDSEVTEGKYYTYTIRAYCNVNGKVQMGGYDNQGVSAAYLKLKAYVAATASTNGYFTFMRVQIRNNTRKPVTFYNDAVFYQNGYTSVVEHMYEYNSKTEDATAHDEIKINSGASKIIQYDLERADRRDFGEGPNIQLQALFEYEGRDYILVATNDYVGFMGLE